MSLSEADDVRDIFADFGTTVYSVNILESSMSNCLATHLTSLQCGTQADFDTNLMQLQDLTMGELLRRMKENSMLTFGLDRFEQAVKKRNWLAHGFFRDKATEFINFSGREIMRQELNAMNAEFHSLNAIIEEIIMNVMIRISPKVSTEVAQLRKADISELLKFIGKDVSYPTQRARINKKKSSLDISPFTRICILEILVLPSSSGGDSLVFRCDYSDFEYFTFGATGPCVKLMLPVQIIQLKPIEIKQLILPTKFELKSKGSFWNYELVAQTGEKFSVTLKDFKEITIEFQSVSGSRRILYRGKVAAVPSPKVEEQL